ncbi:hypothetical protein [Salinifilum ghardaiensis]
MAENAATELAPGESATRDRGQRVGRSAGGRLVQLRRRVSEPGFVVTVDAEPAGGETTELITADWGAANTTFDRFMRRY